MIHEIKDQNNKPVLDTILRSEIIYTLESDLTSIKTNGLLITIDKDKTVEHLIETKVTIEEVTYE